MWEEQVVERIDENTFPKGKRLDYQTGGGAGSIELVLDIIALIWLSWTRMRFWLIAMHARVPGKRDTIGQGIDGNLFQPLVS